MNKKPKTRTIAGMECLGRDGAADRLGCSKSKLDRLVARSRTGKEKVRLRFYQLDKGAPIWFPVIWLDSFVNEIIEKGCRV